MRQIYRKLPVWTMIACGVDNGDLALDITLDATYNKSENWLPENYFRNDKSVLCYAVCDKIDKTITNTLFWYLLYFVWMYFCELRYMIDSMQYFYLHTWNVSINLNFIIFDHITPANSNNGSHFGSGLLSILHSVSKSPVGMMSWYSSFILLSVHFWPQFGI